MDSSSVKPPIISVWELLRDSVMSSYQEGLNGKKVEQTLTTIINSCQVKKNWYVPLMNDIEHQESQALCEEQYTAFCTWLLGRLFCILGRETLVDIHPSCVKAQIHILQVCAENQIMIRFFFLEYIGCVKDLLALQTSETLHSNGPHLLKRFTPLPSKALEKLDLVPKYILIKSLDLVSNLESYLVEIIESMIPNVVHLHEDLIVQCWFVLCEVLQLGTPRLKLAVLKTFLKIISTSTFNNRIALAELCNILKFITQAIPNHLLARDKALVVQNLLSGITDLVNVIVSKGCYGNDVSRLKDLLTVLHSVISLWDVEWKSDVGLSTACNCVVLILDSLPCGSINLDNFQFLMKKLGTQEFAVMILEKCIFYEILDYLKSTKQYKSLVRFERGPLKDGNPGALLCVNAVPTIPIWSTLYDQMWADISSLQSSFPVQPSEQMLQGICDLIGKLKSIIRCAVGVYILHISCPESKIMKVSYNFFQGKAGELISFLQFLLIQLTLLKSSGVAVCFSEAIYNSVILSVRYLFLLPEVCSSSSVDLELAMSILAIPWIDSGKKPDFKMETQLALMPSLFPELQSNEMRLLTIHAIANVPCNEAASWKFSLFSKIIDKIEDPTNIRLASEVIQTLPVLLLDPSQHPFDLLQSLLLPALEAESDLILTSVSEVFSPIVCTLAGNLSSVSTLGCNGYPQRIHVCLTCNKNFQGISVEARNLLSEMKDVISRFIALLPSPVVAVRRNIAASLGSLVLHLPSMYKPDTVNALMKYAEDEDYQVRLTFSRMVKFLIFSRDWMEGKEVESEHLREEHIPLTQVDRIELSHSRPRLDRVLQMLFTALNSKLSQTDNMDTSMPDTLLSTIVDIGCVPLDCVLLPVLKIVLLCVSHPKFRQPSFGQVYLKRIAIAHNTNVKNLYHRFQSDICQVLICVMGMNFHERPMWTKVMDKVVYSFGFESTSVWLRQSLRCVLPLIMVYVVKFDDTPFFNKIIELLRCSATSLIKECFQYIYPFVILNESNHIVQECVKIMEEMSGTNANELILLSFKTIHNELLLHYHSKKLLVEEGICQLIDVLEKSDNEATKFHKNAPSKTDIAEHLEKRFLGVLVHFDSLLESSSAEESSKISALQSLPQIILLMGSKYITPVRFKVLSTLRTALRLTHCDFPHLSCGAWEAFIQSVDIKELSPLLGTVAASLLPLLDQYPGEISEMLGWLVVEHEPELSNHIPDLFFLPNKPVLHDVYQIVQNHVAKKRRELNGSQNLANYLQQPLRFIAHDNVDIRRHGLEYLLSLFKEKQAQFTKSLLQGEVVHDDIAKLLCLLVEGCRDTDQDIRLLCVENLGLLGALDPGHLPHKKPGIGMPQILTVHDDQFVIQALTALAKAYQAARNTRYLDSFSLAIQDLLRYYNISSQPVQSRKNLWDSFPVSIQQIMAPLENSSYIMTGLQANPIWPHPLFGTRYAATLTTWAHTWACRVVTFIEEGKAKEILSVCIPSLKTDINCVLYFLPFILLYAVIPGQEDQHKMMVEEMTFIIQQRSLREEQEEMDHTNVANEKYQIQLDRSVSLPRPVDSDSTTHALCSKTVITLLDFLDKWVGWSRKRTEDTKKDSSPVQNVLSFLNQFSKLDLARGNYDVNEYARALMYLEDFLMEDKELLKDQDHLSFLGRIYAQMKEPDGIKGVLAIQCSQPKLLDAVVYHEVADQYQEALACYELLAKQHSNDALTPSIQKGMIRCCLSLDQPYAALHIAEGAISKRPEYRSSFLEAQAECFWRIHSFENLEGALKDPKLEDATSWGVSIGRCLIDIRNGDQISLQQHLCSTRSYLGKALSTASLENGSYLQGYPQVIKLHMLQELEEATKVIVMLRSLDTTEQSCLDTIKGLVKKWEDRLELVQAASSVQEPLLRLRRCLLQIASVYVKEDQYSLSSMLYKELGTCWLKSAEVARIGERFQQAYIYLLNAEKYKPKRHFIELAKLHWQKNEQDHALATLRRGLDEHFPNSKEFHKMDSETLVDDRKICAEAKLLVAKYNDQNMNVDLTVNVLNYREAVDVYRCWEKSHACLAQYYDRMSLTSDDPFDLADYQLWAVISYIKSLRFGCSLIYQSMSRILTLWLDYGKRYHSALKQSSTPTANQAKVMLERKTILDKMNRYIGSHVDVLPSYMFMIGFTQLVSRICHPVAEVYGVIKNIIVKLLVCYPQQTMWMLLAINRSAYPQRRTRCQAVLDDLQIKRTPNLLRLTEDFVKIGQLLADLCHNPVPKDVMKTNVNSIVKNLPKILAHPSFSKIIVPIQCIRTLTLPQQDSSSLPNHEPFPLETPFIAGIKDEVTILGSLQRPRKITLRGSDGLCYEMMCKDKDDLRLDARVMEFNSIVNKYLQKDPASRSRSLNIRTYSVVPLNEESGLIEWVPNLNAFRLIVTQLYKEMGCFTSNREIRKYIPEKDAKLPERRNLFLKKLIPMHPPVFRNWFRNNFTDSRSWFEARKSYVHTLAVMSMVGYILGLGDRHGENILLDTTCGDVVHVDFNCLFGKGERFECPERVPFRLTHNMVSAMGPTGVEGPFRHACEITLHMLREMRETLLSVLQPFVYDPNVNDPQAVARRPQIPKKGEQDEMTNDSAVENVKNIDHRLNGMMKVGQEKSTLQLSVEGQTAVLIQEATSVDNLCQMYIGWGGYI